MYEWNIELITNKYIRNFILVIGVILVTPFNYLQAEVWLTKNQWSSDWESKYSKWVETEWDDEVFVRPSSILQGLETDCADATYAMRILFSYLNNLPFQSHVKTSAVINYLRQGRMNFVPPGKDIINNGYISNSINTFDNIENPEKRLRAFLKAFFEYAGSASLSSDSYPIEISRKSLTPGSIYVNPNDHSYQIKRINANGVPTSYSSTTPAKVRYLQVLESFPLLSPADFKEFKDGYRAFKWPGQLDANEASLPNYSLMQFDLAKKYPDDFMKLGDELSKFLMIVPETTAQKMERGIINLCYALQGRAYIIMQTQRLRDSVGGRCFGLVDYDAESTPSRDKKIENFFSYLNNIYLNSSASELKYSSYYPILLGIFTDDPVKIKAATTWCSYSHFDSSLDSLSIRSIFKNIENHSFISDPNAPRPQRWGMDPYQPVCPQY